MYIKKRSLLVIIVNTYISSLISILCINYWFQEIQTKAFVFYILGVLSVSILPILMSLLLWESKGVKYEDENKGYFFWCILLSVLFYLSYKALIDISYVRLLYIFNVVYVIIIGYLQNRLDNKRSTKLNNPSITKVDYLRSICVICGIQQIIVIICWNFVKIYICAISIGAISVLCLSVLETSVYFSINSNQLRKKVIYMNFANIAMLVIMYIYLYYEKSSLGYNWLSSRENYTNSFIHLLANVSLVLLQVPLWKYAIALESIEEI